jgi:hypothetical protein
VYPIAPAWTVLLNLVIPHQIVREMARLQAKEILWVILNQKQLLDKRVLKIQGMFHEISKSSSQLAGKRLLLYCHQFPHGIFLVHWLIHDKIL